MRLAKALVEKRNAFIFSFVKKHHDPKYASVADAKKNPKLTAEKINTAIGEKFGGTKMRPQAVYEQRDLALRQLFREGGVNANSEAPPTVAGRRPGRSPKNGTPQTISIAGRNPGAMPKSGTFEIDLDTPEGMSLLTMLAEQAGLRFRT